MKIQTFVKLTGVAGAVLIALFVIVATHGHVLDGFHPGRAALYVAWFIGMLVVLVITNGPRPVNRPLPEMRDFADFESDWKAAGAEAFLASCEMVGEPIPDPGHPEQLPIALWKVPDRYGPDLALDCHNGTRDEETYLYERILLRVPATCSDPIEAAAWTYGTDPDTYRGLVRRT